MIDRHLALDLGLDLVHQLHRLEDAERLPRDDDVTLVDERRGARIASSVEGADHRRLDADHARRRRWAAPRDGQLVRDPVRRGPGRRGRTLVAAPHGHPHAPVLDRHLVDARLLDDAHDLPDPLRPDGLEAREVARRAAARARGSPAGAARPPRRTAPGAGAPPRSRPDPRPTHATSASSTASSDDSSSPLTSLTARSTVSSIAAGGEPKRPVSSPRSSSTTV